MRSRPTSARRAAAVVVVCAFAMTACGARLTEDQRTSALSQGTGGGGGPGATGSGGDTSTGTTGTGSTGTTGTGTTGTTGSTSGTGTTGTSGSTSGSTGTTGTSGSTTGTGAGGGDFTKAPPGGNGGKTDVGITADSITIYNISDVSGAVPGLFEDARFATQAYIKYFTARYGTIYGRKINLVTRDSQLDSGANRAAALELCEKGFAGVGSISAFDQGAAAPEKECGVPDLRGLATTDQMKAVPNVYPINAAGTGNNRGLAQFAWAAQSSDPKIKASIKKAGYIYSDGEVTRQQSSQDKEASTKAYGFNWIADEPFPTSSTDYTGVVADLKKKGVEYVTFSGAYQQAAGIVKTMKQQDYNPVVWQPTVTAYTPDYLQQAGSAAEGTYVAVTTTLIEEIDQSPELQLYNQWLQQVAPGKTPTNLGQYSWGAAAFFIEKMIELGPKPTRKALLALVAQEHGYDANGLFPAQDVGGKRLSDCIQVTRVVGGKWVRQVPTQKHTWECTAGVWDFKSGRKIPGYPK